MSNIEQIIRERLFELQDETYKDLTCKLIPTLNAATVIGVRTPVLRSLVEELSGQPEIEEFLGILPHGYYEENNVHAALIGCMEDYDEVIAALEVFLPHVDNWATCDGMAPEVLGKHLPELYTRLCQWLKSEHTYTVRFAIGTLMRFYLDDDFFPETLETVAEVKSGEYYVNMMIAWYFATALAKQYPAAVVFLEQKRLDKWVHNKTIQKAVESQRITDGHKAYLRTLKII